MYKCEQTCLAAHKKGPILYMYHKMIYIYLLHNGVVQTLLIAFIHNFNHIKTSPYNLEVHLYVKRDLSIGYTSCMEIFFVAQGRLFSIFPSFNPMNIGLAFYVLFYHRYHILFLVNKSTKKCTA